MKRRDFLGLLGGTAASLGAGLPVLGAPRRKPTIVVITDVTPDIHLPRFVAMLGTMLAQGLPVTCIVHTTSPSGQKLTPDSELSRMIRRFLRAAPGVLEIVAHVDDLSRRTEYEQARVAYQTRKELIEALFPPETAEFSGPLIQSIATTFVKNAFEPHGVRSAGLRNILALPDTSATVKSEYWDMGILRLSGGVRADIFGALEHLDRLAPEQFQNILLLSVRDNMDKPEHLLKAAAKVFANVALQHEADQWISNLRLADIQLRDGYFRFERHVGLHLFEPSFSDTALYDGHRAFQSLLTQEGIAFSTGLPLNPVDDAAQSHGYWVETENLRPPKSASQPLVDLHCGSKTSGVPVGSDKLLNPGIGLALDRHVGGIQGIDSCGHLLIPTIEVTTSDLRNNRRLTGTTNVNDLILTIAPEQTTSFAQRNFLRAELKKLTGDWVTKIVPVPKLVNQLVPRSPLISLYRHTESYMPRIGTDPKPLSDKDRELLYEDAVTAWSYFYRFTNKNTGLCPATVFYAGGTKNALNSATMWDIGSHINALMAAVDIGLINEKKFRRNIASILANIKGKPDNGRLLPNEWIKTNRNNRGNTNFDGCDAGRLLAALYNLQKHRFADDTAQRLIESWTLEKTIEDKKIYSVIEGDLKSTYNSHCAHYAALAFRKWGFDITSPYEVFAGDSASDDKMALLEAAAVIGPIGAEPLLLEALDFGLTPEASYLADMLFGAQLREFDTTGDLICVSESPIDRSPWFTYQGLQMNAPEDRTWVIDTVRDDPKYLTEKFQKEFRVTATKAAFLWAAEKPHDFSRALLDYVRKHGRTTVGFASAIYSRSDKPTRNYTDINTNGIILQSIAKMLSSGAESG